MSLQIIGWGAASILAAFVVILLLSFLATVITKSISGTYFGEKREHLRLLLQIKGGEDVYRSDVQRKEN